MPKIGEMTELAEFDTGVYVPGFNSSDPANPDVKVPMGLFGTVVDASGDHTTPTNIGAVPGGTVVATERGDGRHHQTTLVLTAFQLGNSGDAASLALGALLYTFPAGVIDVRTARIKGGVTIADAIKTDTPEIGLGTVIGSGANATLGAVGTTSENIFEGTAVADCNGTEFNGVKKATASPFSLLIPAASVHTVYFNIADGWADLTAASLLTFTGTIVIEWDFLGA